ncbi:roadblock/LC7 domain-containing protein [Lentzea sp. NBRC 102530]|uniref:roadblock/LC7 domain-containing protein n=1 Tax=Lentzea sp. NBRC 102530 TaxID=3032201 RepID=UPI0025537E0A|nr:roadblock/LC7 domain-containing protein [Lentzea sp. NBRC 102530]
MLVLSGSPFPIQDWSELDYDALNAEMRKLREAVAGVTDTMIAASDGIPIVADVAKNVDPAHISALAASSLGIARQSAEVIGMGTLSQTVVFSSEGYMAVYAIGRLSLLVVLGDKGLNLGRLLHESRPVIERVGAILAA